MKNKTKTASYILITLFTALFIGVIITNTIVLKKIVDQQYIQDLNDGFNGGFDDLNDGFNGDFDFGETAGRNARLDNFVYEGGFGCYRLVSDDGLTSYSFSGFPDVLDDYCLTRFSTEDSKYKLWGISVGSNTSEAKAVLTEHGYELYDYFETSETCVYKLGKASITLSGADTVERLSIRLTSTNIQGVVF